MNCFSDSPFTSVSLSSVYGGLVYNLFGSCFRFFVNFITLFWDMHVEKELLPTVFIHFLQGRTLISPARNFGSPATKNILVEISSSDRYLYFIRDIRV